MADNKKGGDMNDFMKKLWGELTKPPQWAKTPAKGGNSGKDAKDGGKKAEADVSKRPKKRQPPPWWSWSSSDGVPIKPTRRITKKTGTHKRTQAAGRLTGSAAASSSSDATSDGGKRNGKGSRQKAGHGQAQGQARERERRQQPQMSQGGSDLGSRSDALSTLHSTFRRYGYSPAVLKSFGMTASKVEPFGPVLRLRTNHGLIALKKTDLSAKHIQFLHDAITYMDAKDFKKVAPFVLTPAGKPYCRVGGDTYYATRWLRGQEVDFRSMPQLALASRTLAEFHEASRGFESKGYTPAMTFDMVDRFAERREELVMWKERAKKKSRPDEVDKFFLKHVERYVTQADQALAILKRPQVRAHLLFEEDDPPLCHLDLTPYNMVYAQQTGFVYLIDLDFCTYGPRTLDVAHLMRRALQREAWEEDVARHILVNYNAIRTLNRTEYLLLQGLLLFPHRFWRVCYEHYDVGHDPHHLGYFQLCEEEEEKRQAFLTRFSRQVERMWR